MEFERTIYFKNLFYRLFKGWRFILIVTAFVTLLSFGYSWMVASKESNNDASAEDTVEALREKLSDDENAMVDLKVSFAEKYMEQKSNIEDYLEESYVLKNVMKQVPSYKYRYLIENEITNIRTYRYLAERRKVNVCQFNFYIDKEYTASLDRFTRDDRQDVTNSIAKSLKDANIAKDLVTLAGINIVKEAYGLYYDVSNSNEGFVTVSLIDAIISEDVKAQIAEYIENKINIQYPRLKELYGDFNVVFDGCSEYLTSDPIVTGLSNINSNIVANLLEDEVISDISVLVGLSDKKKIRKYINAYSSDNYICVRINNADIDDTMDEKIREYLDRKIPEIVADSMSILGQCDITFVEVINNKDTDPIQNDIYNIINAMIYSFNESDFKATVSDILGVDFQFVNDYLSVSSEGTYFQYTINYLDLSDAKIEQIKKAIDEKFASIYDNLSNKLGKYNVSYFGINKTSIFNTTGTSSRISQINSINSLIESINKLKDGMNDTQIKLFDKLSGNIDDSDSETQEYSIIKLIVKNAIVAVVLGVILGCLLIVVKYIFNDKLQCAEDLDNNGIKVWGIIDAVACEKSNRFDKFIDKLFYSDIYGNEKDVEINLLASKINSYLNNNDISKLLLMGTDNSLCEEDFKKVLDKIDSDRVAILDNSLVRADVVSQLYLCNEVLIVETILGASRVNINKELELCSLCKKKVLGAIVLV